MNFKTLLSKILNPSTLNEVTASPKLGASEQKDRAKSGAGNNLAKDAARKRIERGKQVPRDRKPKQELIKEVILVETKSGRIQLIFKDSFNASLHKKLNKDVLTLEEAQQATNSKEFEQTRASKLLFGDTKQKEGSKKEGKKEEESKGKREGKDKEESKSSSGEKKESGKAKKLSKDQMFQAMSEMEPDQLLGMPPELRNEYFKMIRKPPANTDFDQLSYENLTVEYGINDTSATPYNQQVMNALVFIAKLKAGASKQEMLTYGSMTEDANDFTRAAFFTARKILSQIGDECIQNLLTNVENGGKPVNAEGASDMQCGEYRFKVAAGGEMSLSTNQFDQSNKNFKGFVAGALTQALSNPDIYASNPTLAASFQKMKQGKAAFSDVLVPDELLSQIKADPEMLKKLQSTPVKDAAGNVTGTVIDEEGNINPLASMGRYIKAWQEGAVELMRGGGSKSPLKTNIINTLLKTVLRGDNIADPKMAPNHLITVNGIFPMTDDYFNTISAESNFDMSKAKDTMTASNISNYKTSAAETLKKYTAIIEETQPKEKKKEKGDGILVPKDSIEPIQLMVDYLVKNHDFLLNASLLPGFNNKDLNSVQYNYVTIGKKTIKIPVMKGENISSEVLGESVIFLNDLLVESLSNNFVLAHLVRNQLITNVEAELIENSSNLLTENAEYVMLNVNAIYENAVVRMYENPVCVIGLINDLVIEEYKRDYKKEYKNYHGKKKQRKERAARGAARDLMIKKGRAKKGDGKDIDHKKPLRSGGSKGINNLRVRDKSDNRADNGHHKGEHQNRH